MHHSNVELFNVEAEGNITSPPWGTHQFVALIDVLFALDYFTEYLSFLKYLFSFVTQVCLSYRNIRLIKSDYNRRPYSTVHTNTNTMTHLLIIKKFHYSK